MQYSFLVIFIFLFLSSQALTRALSSFLHGVIRHEGLSTRFFALFFLPGVIIHELSHALMAFLLFVPVGKMEFLPVADGDHVKLGSVQVGKSDPFRRTLIGVAPVIVGIVVLGALMYYFMPKGIVDAYTRPWLTVAILYAVFVISNTMFSSRKDLEGTILLAGCFMLIITVLYFAGLRIPQEVVEFFRSEPIQELFRMGSVFLAVPLVINMLFIILLRLLIRR